MTEVYDTIEEQIEGELDQEISYRNLHTYVNVVDKDTQASLVVPYFSFTNTYRNYLMDSIIEVELGDEDYEHFRQNPQAVSDYYYGTILYWSFILEINNCKSRMDFDKRTIKLYDPEEFENIVEEIMNKEGLLENIV